MELPLPTDQNRRSFLNRLQVGLIGPGSETLWPDDQVEIISDYPVRRYFGGILFPKRSALVAPLGEQVELEARIGENALDPEKNTNEEPFPIVRQDGPPEGMIETNQSIVKGQEAEEEAGRVSANYYFPTNMGLSFCVSQSTESIPVTFQFGVYRKLSKTEREVSLTRAEYDRLAELSQLTAHPINELVTFSDNSIRLTLDGAKETILSLRTWYKESAEILNLEGYRRVRSLLSDTLWQRAAVTERVDIELPHENITFSEKLWTRTINSKNELGATYHVRIILREGRKYVKVLLENSSTDHPGSKFSNGNDLLNHKCLFQVGIEVHQTEILPYKPHQFRNPYDQEAETISYQYREVKAFGIGHSCSVCWPRAIPVVGISTIHLPEVDIRHYSNAFRNEIPTEVREVSKLKNLSIWTSLSRVEIQQRLSRFVDSYEDWLNKQRTKAEEDISNKELYNPLLEAHKGLIARLRSNVASLDNDLIFRCFKLANTAMYIQMIISRDQNGAFGNTIKELKDFEGLPHAPYKSLEYFSEYNHFDINYREPQYRPFQLAFLLLNLKDMAYPAATMDNSREVVDLIWFPTGGGKTEAYLALTAYTILLRNITNPGKSDGVAVIMRYTLRLLTAQQFERASRLIVALEFLRVKLIESGDASLGETPISIGMWVGRSTTPNKLKDAHTKVEELDREIERKNNGTSVNLESKNQFPLSSCPWCGCNLISTHPKTGKLVMGYESSNAKGRISFTTKCLNNSCHFTTELPIYFIDQQIYQKRPTLLFGTVDKFAQLPHIEEGHQLFNSLDNEKLPPDLIIQDELHLLSGPLGSVVGLFETIILELCTRPSRIPKIVASTATTRNTSQQITGLYNREVSIFPAPGITYEDNFFSYVSEDSQRRHTGFMPSGKSSLETQIQILAHLLYARAELYQHYLAQPDGEAGAIQAIDPFWTIVSYYNSLRDVGRAYNDVGARLKEALETLHIRYKMHPALGFNYRGLDYRAYELTSRVPSYEIKQVLDKLGQPFALGKNDKTGNTQVENTVDLVLATNMLSVGIDISRLNIMLMNGQPRNIAEYIQASSRVGRDKKGLVINLMDPNRAREKSLFENYVSVNLAYYQYVEPLSVTPYTEIALEKMLKSLLITHVRHVQNRAANGEAVNYKSGDYEGIKELLLKRIQDPTQKAYAEQLLKQLNDNWVQKTLEIAQLQYKNNRDKSRGLIDPPDKFTSDWNLMESMREVDTSSIIRIVPSTLKQ
ncbi:helicase-related protein [Persicitalea jodogahamensis]|uniref:DNA helicase n=1 Tax=Persicitalea jodogahamensis TaxID=402147 RepID=A0A8J3DCS7_9BACT|nr:helicase-related protein [Persicitalea jodogahamensis]GHB83888.1 DNA helicase [Persicitalea jodogahamensis]